MFWNSVYTQGLTDDLVRHTPTRQGIRSGSPCVCMHVRAGRLRCTFAYPCTRACRRASVHAPVRANVDVSAPCMCVHVERCTPVTCARGDRVRAPVRVDVYVPCTCVCTWTCAPVDVCARGGALPAPLSDKRFHGGLIWGWRDGLCVAVFMWYALQGPCYTGLRLIIDSVHHCLRAFSSGWRAIATVSCPPSKSRGSG